MDRPAACETCARGSRPGEPPPLAAPAAAAADPGPRAPRGRGRERRRRRGPPPPGRLRVQRRAATERGAAARRLGAPEDRRRALVEPLAAPIPLGTRLFVVLDVELRIGDSAEDRAGARQLRAVDVPLGIPELGPQQGFRALTRRLFDLDDDPELQLLPLDGAGRQ